ncbi:retrovirus-related pol polyprotein from transposon TNT 1-94 [Tanacetum coccineum]
MIPSNIIYLYVCPAVGSTCADIMADLNIPANDAPVEQAPAVAPPTRTDDHILPLSKWVPIGKSNCVLDVHKPQRNPIFPIAVALLKNTNFFRAFTASSMIMAIYIQQFWDTMCFNSSTGDTVIEYVNMLGYPSALRNESAMSVNALYQPWRAILSMINMCLTSKTAGYARPRHLVLQILWGIIHRSNIDYAERIWEEFVQSIQTFLTDRKNLATAARGKKKTAHLLIPSVRFTKLIIHHLRTKHNIHPRTGSPLHYSHKESIMNTLRFVGKDERGKAEEGGAKESSDATNVTKPKAAKVTKPASDKAPKPTATQPPKPKPAPTQPSKAVSEKKQKLVKETPDEPSPTKRSKGGLVGKRLKPKSLLKLVNEPSDEGFPIEELAHTDKEADLQRALELSLKEQAERTHGPARPMTPTKKSPVDQFIFQRRPPMHTEPTGHADSPFLDAELPLTDSETESNEEVHVIYAGDQDEGQAVPNPGEQDEGQAGPNPGIHDEGQAGLNPGDAAESQPQPSHGVHAGPNHLSFIDQFFVKNPHKEESGKTNAEIEVQSMVSVPIHQDTSSVSPMTTPVIDLRTMQSDSLLPRSTTTTSIITTTTSLPSPPQPRQSITDLILVSQAVDEIVTDAVDWAMQAPLRARFRDLPTVDMKEILQQLMFEDNSYKAHEVHNDLYEALQKSLELDYSNQRLADQEEARKKKRKKRAAPRTPSGSLPSPPPPPPPLAGASGAPGISGTSRSSQLPPPPLPPSTGTSGSAQQQGSKAPSSSKPAASTHQSMAWTTSDTRFESTGFMATQELSLTDSLMQDDSIPDKHVHLSDDEDSRNDHLPKAESRQDWWKPLLEEERPATSEPAWTIPSSNVSDIENNWASTLVSTNETPAKNSLLAKTEDMTTFMKWYCRQVNKTSRTQADFKGQAYEVLKAFYPDVIHLQFQMEDCRKMFTDQIDWTNPEGDQVRVDVNQPLPLGGPPGHGSNPALSISKIKAASYPDFGLELLVPKQMWIDDVCTYDISVKYGISHWWFNRQKFYIDRHDSLSRRKDVRTHMRILNVVRIKAYSRYGYDHLSKIILRRDNFQEHTIVEKDFKNLYPSDFKDLNQLLLQGHLDHLPGSDKWMLSTTITTYNFHKCKYPSIKLDDVQSISYI